MVVEDQDDLWTLVNFCLAKHFSDVTLHWCSNPNEAITFLFGCMTSPSSLPKLILQDLYLPGSDAGFIVLKDIQMLLGSQQIPILVMSSSIEESNVRQAYQHGARFYIVKPQTINGWPSLNQSLRQCWGSRAYCP